MKPFDIVKPLLVVMELGAVMHVVAASVQLPYYSERLAIVVQPRATRDRQETVALQVLLNANPRREVSD